MTAAARPYSLGLRLSRLFAALTLIGFGVLSTVIYLVASMHLSAKADVELARKADLVRHLVQEAGSNGDTSTLRHKLEEFFEVHGDLHVMLTSRDHRPFFESINQFPADGPRRSVTFSVSGVVPGSDLAWATIDMDRSGDARLLAGLAILLVIATLLGALAVSLAGFWLVRNSLAPLRGLAEQTRAIRIDELGGHKLALSRPVEELEPWIGQFNSLIARLEQTYTQLEAFNADVAHELRTPLATLIAQSEVLLSRPRREEELRDTLGSNLEELHRLSSVVNDMLFLARADRGAQARTSAAAPLSGEAAQVLEFYDGAMREAGMSARIEGEAVAPFDAGLVRRAISNLLSNALRYADPTSEIVIELREDAGRAWLIVGNSGAALEPSILPRIFDRFFRAQTSREGSGANHGLGLAIVSAIARMHGGSTSADCRDGRTRIGFSIRTAIQA